MQNKTLEGRKTFKRAIRKGGEKNVPVVVAIVAEKSGDKYKLTRKGVEVGISSLFIFSLPFIAIPSSFIKQLSDFHQNKTPYA